MGVSITSWFEVDVAHCPWLRWGRWGLLSACGLRWTWLGVTSWSQVVVVSAVLPTWRRRGDLGVTPTLSEQRHNGRSNSQKMSLRG